MEEVKIAAVANAIVGDEIRRAHHGESSAPHAERQIIGGKGIGDGRVVGGLTDRITGREKDFRRAKIAAD